MLRIYQNCQNPSRDGTGLTHIPSRPNRAIYDHVDISNFNTELHLTKIDPYLTISEELDAVLTHVGKLRVRAFQRG